MSDVVYLYGFVPAASAARPDTVRGIDDAAVELLPLGPLHAVISHLPADAYGGDAVNARLQDLGWLAERGVAHERVVAWLVDHGEVLPAGLLTLFSSVRALEQHTALRSRSLLAQLERLHGCREWDLKVAYRREQLEQHAGAVSPEVRELDEEMARAAPGRRFLLSRKRDDLVRRELGAAARHAASELLDRLRPYASASVTLPPPRDVVDLPVVLAAALLVERERESALRDTFAAEAAVLEPLGFTVELTGPWAAYRFLDEDRGETV